MVILLSFVCCSGRWPFSVWSMSHCLCVFWPKKKPRCRWMCRKYFIGKIGRPGLTVGGFNEIRNKYWTLCYCHSIGCTSIVQRYWPRILFANSCVARTANVLIEKRNNRGWSCTRNLRREKQTQYGNRRGKRFAFIVFNHLSAVRNLQHSAVFVRQCSIPLFFFFFRFICIRCAHSLRTVAAHFQFCINAFCFGTNKVQSYPARQMNNLKVYFLASLASMHRWMLRNAMFILPSNDVFAFHLHLGFWLSSPFLSVWVCVCVCELMGLKQKYNLIRWRCLAIKWKATKHMNDTACACDRMRRRADDGMVVVARKTLWSDADDSKMHFTCNLSNRCFQHPSVVKTP